MLRRRTCARASIMAAVWRWKTARENQLTPHPPGNWGDSDGVQLSMGQAACDEVQPLGSKCRREILAAQARKHERENPRSWRNPGRNRRAQWNPIQGDLECHTCYTSPASDSVGHHKGLGIGHPCVHQIGRSNVCQHPEHGFLQLIDAGTWISHAANPRFPNRTRAVIKAALHQAGPWNYRQFIPAIIRAMVDREPQVQTLLRRLLGSGALLKDPARAVCFPLLVSKPEWEAMRWELVPLQVHADEKHHRGRVIGLETSLTRQGMVLPARGKDLLEQVWFSQPK